MLVVPKNWREFQHYKDRCPPWIRLHRKLLDNKDFHRLPVSSRALAPMLWLLASESVDGVIDADPDGLAFRLRSTEKEIATALRPLLERGFFVVLQDDSNTLASCKQVAAPETETEASPETEALTEAVSDRPAPADRSPAKPKSAATWESYGVAYEHRYGVAPIRNAKVNAQMAQFVGMVPHEEAPLIAAFYVANNSRFYVSCGHSVGMLVRDAEKLRTEWATGRQVTAAQAVQADKTQTNFNAFGSMLAEARAKEQDDAQRKVA